MLLTEPLPFAEFARLLGHCKFAITDSGGIQEEAPSLGKPVLVTRDSTERTEGVEAGDAEAGGHRSWPDRVVRHRSARRHRLLRAHGERGEPLWRGRAAERIVAASEHLQRGGYAPEPFGAGYTRLAVLNAAGYEFHLEERDLVRNIEEVEEEQPQAEQAWPPR